MQEEQMAKELPSEESVSAGEQETAARRKKWLLLGLATGGALVGIGVLMLWGMKKINNAVRDITKGFEE